MLIQKELKVLMPFCRLRSVLPPMAPAIVAVIMAALTPALAADVIQAVLTKVNGEVLTKTDIEQRQVQALRARGILPADDEALKKAIAEVTPSLLVETIDESKAFIAAEVPKRPQGMLESLRTCSLAIMRAR